MHNVFTILLTMCWIWWSGGTRVGALASQTFNNDLTTLGTTKASITDRNVVGNRGCERKLLQCSVSAALSRDTANPTCDGWVQFG